MKNNRPFGSFQFCQISQFLDSQGFSDYVERVTTSDGGFNLLHKLQDAIGRGQSPAVILPSQGELEIITISDPEVGSEGDMLMPPF